jgi:hypothetical protein
VIRSMTSAEVRKDNVELSLIALELQVEGNSPTKIKVDCNYLLYQRTKQCCLTITNKLYLTITLSLVAAY